MSPQRAPEQAPPHRPSGVSPAAGRGPVCAQVLCAGTDARGLQSQVLQTDDPSGGDHRTTQPLLSRSREASRLTETPFPPEQHTPRPVEDKSGKPGWKGSREPCGDCQAQPPGPRQEGRAGSPRGDPSPPSRNLSSGRAPGGPQPSRRCLHLSPPQLLLPGGQAATPPPLDSWTVHPAHPAPPMPSLCCPQQTRAAGRITGRAGLGLFLGDRSLWGGGESTFHCPARSPRLSSRRTGPGARRGAGSPGPPRCPPAPGPASSWARWRSRGRRLRGGGRREGELEVWLEGCASHTLTGALGGHPGDGRTPARAGLPDTGTRHSVSAAHGVRCGVFRPLLTLETITSQGNCNHLLGSLQSLYAESTRVKHTDQRTRGVAPMSPRRLPQPRAGPWAPSRAWRPGVESSSLP